MATLENIRKRSGLLLAVIGIAMLAFILGDFMQSKRTGSSGSVFVGEVLGEDVHIQEFEQKVQQGIDNWKAQNTSAVLNQTVIGQLRSQIWDQYVRELIMNHEFEKLGIGLSEEEWMERISGIHVHPEISKIPAFQDPTTQQFDRTKVLGYLKQIDQDPTGEAREKWIGFQEYMVGLIKNNKYNTLVAQSMYVNAEEAKISFNENTQKATFNYVAVPYSFIADSVTEPTEKEINAYYNDHQLEYEQDASSDVDFVVFTISPSLEDDAATKSSLEALKSDFAVVEDYDLMARRNSDNTSAKFVYASEDELQDTAWNKLFAADKGTVIGPYLFADGTYRIAKLAEVQNRPDSVEARHILLAPNQNISIDSIQKKIEALKELIENGSDFGMLAEQNSEDKGSAIKGGDLGWFQEGVMVDEFNEACFSSSVGALSIVTSQFGVHLIEVTNKSKSVRKVKVAYIDRIVEPSSETMNHYYTQAALFTGKIINEGIAFDSLVVEQNLVKRSDAKVKEDKQNISGLPNSRPLVKWMNDAEVGDLSEIFNFDNFYVIAYLTKKHEEGVTPLEDIKEQITALVHKEKKEELLYKQMLNAENLESLATKMNSSVESGKQTTLSNISIQGIGYEPELVGGIHGVEKGSISKPIKGRNAMYVVEIKERDEDVLVGDFSSQRNQLKTGLTNSGGTAFKVLKENAAVVDNRNAFY